MFISESYIHYQDDLSHTAGYDVDEFVDISFDLHPLRRNSDVALKSKYLSKSADLVYRSRIASNAPGYDGDTDSDSNEPRSPDPSSLHTRCNICNIDFIHSFLDNTNRKDPLGKSRTRRRRRKSLSYDVFKNCTLQCVDFDKYKDEKHRMEVFAPDSERKWTLQYEYDRERDQKTLAKVIIGRGQNDDYPELNNIHLIDELKDYKLCKGRDKWLGLLKERNELTKEQYSLMPSVNTCLFCFNERNKDILKNIAHQSPYAFSLPSSMINEISDIDLNGSASEKQEDGNLGSHTGARSPGDPTKVKGKSSRKEKHLKNISTPNALSGKTSPKHGKLVRTGYFSDKLFKTFTKKEVNIDLDGNSSSVGSPSNIVLNDAVNIVLMYPDVEPIINESGRVPPQSTEGAGGEEKMFVVEQNGLEAGTRERRIVRRKFNDQGFANGQIERGNSVEAGDDDDDSFVIM